MSSKMIGAAITSKIIEPMISIDRFMTEYTDKRGLVPASPFVWLRESLFPRGAAMSEILIRRTESGALSVVIPR
jgi:hypothetical protein